MKHNLQIQQNVPLAPFTTLEIGGNARYLVRAATEQQVVETVKFAYSNQLKLFVLGGGSNVLVSDLGFDGVVLRVELNGIDTEKASDSAPSLARGANSAAKIPASKHLVVGAGEDWDGFVAYCVENNLAGIECLSGIPGTVGGTPVQNVGAYGQEVSETILEVRCLDRTSGEIVVLSNSECKFSYRTSIFNSIYRERFIVLSVTFAMLSNGEPKVVYRDLKDYFDGFRPSLSDVREAVLKIRRSKSMVIDAEDPNSKSAGSFFKNPLVTPDELEEIRNANPSLPFFEFGEMFKIPAAWLIENAGFSKGFALGNAGISAKHTLALINRGDATAAELIRLKEQIQAAVMESFGIVLHPEPVFVGF